MGRAKRSAVEEAQAESLFLVLWWMSQTPCAALLASEVAAEAAAKVRNGIVIEIIGRDLDVEQVHDWYRRDEAGNPMPAQWRDLVGQIHVPMLRTPQAAEASA
jgi:hypothetical protein